MDSQIDHTTGLLMLREGCPHEIYCSDMVYEDLTTGFPLFRMLEHWNGGINRNSIPLNGDTFTIPASMELSLERSLSKAKLHHTLRTGTTLILAIILESGDRY